MMLHVLIILLAAQIVVCGLLARNSLASYRAAMEQLRHLESENNGQE